MNTLGHRVASSPRDCNPSVRRGDDSVPGYLRKKAWNINLAVHRGNGSALACVRKE
ncbi:hypothetical protein EV186_108375 [Labedaea rhizosphaerae]|uniref:Uncharacterized protein n=1 Tax=Labedaea rhizosphaerae TaxID=598644 RepID=A0A4R6RYE7_LABRH|nr:hypothetical protein EV186_108375 [Labedaea rhizosphaerae]